MPSVCIEGSMIMHSIPNPARVRFTGPLAPFADGLTAELTALGYTATSATTQLQLAAHLSRWLHGRGLDTTELAGPVIMEFLADRRRDHRNLSSLQALNPTLAYLRRLGVAPPEEVPRAPGGAGEVLLARFRHYLLVERSVSVPVAEAYVRWVRPFLLAVVATDPDLRLDDLNAAQVTRFLTGHLPGLTRKSAQMSACALRAFLRFLHAEGLTPVGLAAAVPASPSGACPGCRSH